VINKVRKLRNWRWNRTRTHCISPCIATLNKIMSLWVVSISNGKWIWWTCNPCKSSMMGIVIYLCASCIFQICMGNPIEKQNGPYPCQSFQSHFVVWMQTWKDHDGSRNWIFKQTFPSVDERRRHRTVQYVQWNESFYRLMSDSYFKDQNDHDTVKNVYQVRYKWELTRWNECSKNGTCQISPKRSLL
jgi:hypothetical protein